MPELDLKIEMHKEPDVDEVLDYLSVCRTTKQIRDKFYFSNSTWHHLKTWMIKAKLINCIKCSNLEAGKTNNTFLYIRINQ